MKLLYAIRTHRFQAQYKLIHVTNNKNKYCIALGKEYGYERFRIPKFLWDRL